MTKETMERLNGNNRWLSPDTIPKDGTPFLIKIKIYPVAIAVYNECDKTICFTTLEDDGMSRFFLSDGCLLKDIEAWQPLPEKPMRLQND